MSLKTTSVRTCDGCGKVADQGFAEHCEWVQVDEYAVRRDFCGGCYDRMLEAFGPDHTFGLRRCAKNYIPVEVQK